MFECWNSRCPNYAPNGVRLKDSEVYPDAQGSMHCNTCGSYVRRAAPSSDDAARGLAGAAGGALLGWAVGGPPGVLIGAVVGLILTSVSGSQES